MIDEIPKQYNPKETEDKWYKIWEDSGYFNAKASANKKPFTIVIPPPNVTGILHMGHALNNTIQDILIRYNRMQNFESLWLPGIDHAGIATQNVVEKSIAKEGLKRQDLGRDKFIERVWEWKDKYGLTIIEQLKKLGASCDWSRLRFTMDEEYSKAVSEVFVRLYKKGLIYQGDYIINWCPRCHTALSDEEAAHKELKGSLYFIRYPLECPDAQGAPYIIVATTRPETMLGDTAVAVNPKDKRYKKLIGKSIKLPLTNRRIKIISDEMVDTEFGTGAVKVTPAHDPNDYLLGRKHNLEFINIMNPDATMNNLSGKYTGLDRFKARKAVLEDLEKEGLLEKTQPHELSAGHCYRCHTIVEPYLSKQWFVKMKPLSKPAINAVKEGKVKFYPQRWTKVYLNWMENIQDWCISRQIWWGHRLPVYYCKSCNEVTVSNQKVENCSKCSSDKIEQDGDVLDTWFSSWLWPFATMHWPNKNSDLEYFYPTSTLVTAPEIIFFWVARMIMAGFEFMGEAPFKDIYIHGTVRDEEGKKMSKSLGNSIDPLEVIKDYGTDALRFSIISITSQGQDVFLSKERFEQGRNFANKIWNAARFILLNIDEELTKEPLEELLRKGEISTTNRWILSCYNLTVKEVADSISKYQFNEAANKLYSFFWHDFCDWYIEIIKHDIKNSQNQSVLVYILEGYLRALHPFMPFVTEELWQRLGNKENSSIMIAPYPKPKKEMQDKKSQECMDLVFQAITGIRNMRLELDIPAQSDNITVNIYAQDKKTVLFLKEHSALITNLARINNLKIESSEYRHRKGEFVFVLGKIHLVMPLEGLIDIQKHISKIHERIEKINADIKNKETMLKNKNFIERAPKEVVEAEKDKLKALNEELTKLKGVEYGLR